VARAEVAVQAAFPAPVGWPTKEPGTIPSSYAGVRTIRRWARDVARRVRTLLRTRERRRTAVALAALATVAGGLATVQRAFSVSCTGEAPCVSLTELREGAALPEAIRIRDRHGEIYAEVAGPLRRALPADRIPDLVAEAFVAVEDRRFWSHDGVDARGVARAAVRNLRDGGISEGASTIPMQLVRTLWSESLREVGPWRRKVIEARTAPELIEQLGHDRVLTLYLNAIYLGNGIYGVERASRYYFGVGVEELSTGQIATLVGMTRSPEYYEPRRHSERARGVRDVVLLLLAEEGVISAEEAEAASAADLELAPLDSVSAPIQRRNHLTAAVTRELRRLAPDLAALPGLDVLTTIDPIVQERAETSLSAQLERIETGRFGAPSEATDSTAPLEGAAVALDARDGAIRAWVGGRDFERSEFDRVDQARRQVGSLAKPFLVALALEQGYGIVDIVSADTIAIATAEGGWLPADHVGETELPLREALVRSSNRAAAHLGVSLGLERLSEIGTRVGLSEPVPPLPSSSIGAFDESLLEMTSAYALFGNRGVRVDPFLIQRIEGGDGELLWERPQSVTEERVLDDAIAFVVLDAMRAVVDRGTGRSVRAWGYRGPAAGKTGTTNDGRDAWFVGLTPELAAGVWIGFDTPRPIVDGQGGGALAAPVWATWMSGLQGRVPQHRAWIPPPGAERVRYDAVSGEVIGPLCRVEVGAAYQEAWVIAGRYDRSVCPRGGIGGFFDRLWRAFIPSEPQPVRPLRGRRGPGG